MPNTWELAIKAIPTLRYAARKAALSDPRVRQSLELAEEGIAVDPWHRLNRQEVDEVVYDMTEAGVMIVFQVVDDEILFLTFVDLGNA